MFEKEYFFLDSNEKTDKTDIDNGDFNDIDIRELRNVNICSSNMYNSIIYLVLIGIIIFFVWFVLSRPYIQDEDLTAKTTPF